MEPKTPTPKEPSVWGFLGNLPSAFGLSQSGKYKFKSEQRAKVHLVAEENPSFYSTLVKPVDVALDMEGFTLSESSGSSIIQNLEDVHHGRINQGEAHRREVLAFRKDDLENPNPVYKVGMGLNSVGFVGMSVINAMRPTVMMENYNKSQFEKIKRLGGGESYDDE